MRWSPSSVRVHEQLVASVLDAHAERRDDANVVMIPPRERGARPLSRIRSRTASSCAAPPIWIRNNWGVIADSKHERAKWTFIPHIINNVHPNLRTQTLRCKKRPQ